MVKVPSMELRRPPDVRPRNHGSAIQPAVPGLRWLHGAVVDRLRALVAANDGRASAVLLQKLWNDAVRMERDLTGCAKHCACITLGGRRHTSDLARAAPKLNTMLALQLHRLFQCHIVVVRRNDVHGDGESVRPDLARSRRPGTDQAPVSWVGLADQLFVQPRQQARQGQLKRSAAVDWLLGLIAAYRLLATTPTLCSPQKSGSGSTLPSTPARSPDIRS
jgi:hypothetical protein